ELILSSYQEFSIYRHHLEAYHEYNMGQYTWGQACHSGSTSFLHPSRELYHQYQIQSSHKSFGHVLFLLIIRQNGWVVLVVWSHDHIQGKTMIFWW
ncbi:4419_t:CDS:2, partial [Gigaspora rosea]